MNMNKKKNKTRNVEIIVLRVCGFLSDRLDELFIYCFKINRRLCGSTALKSSVSDWKSNGITVQCRLKDFSLAHSDPMIQ